ncbi:hypothetical protein [Cupriavidus sp. RAF12]|uniref:hypothetical protein n=1 Tax=Cupriavidus sp. RAF12 TaxID=3233050 RepID=UPI003F9032E0
MGQVNLVRYGVPYITQGGSITLTSGALAQHPVPGGAAVSTVNAGIEAFGRAAALELKGKFNSCAEDLFLDRSDLARLGSSKCSSSRAETVRVRHR